MKSALLRLREYQDQLSPTEKAVALKILENPEMVMELGIHQLAETTFTSASTITRLCRHIQFDGYRSFRRAVTYELAFRKHNQQEEEEKILKTDGIQEIIDKISYQNIISLEETKNLMEPEVIQKCMELLKSCHTVQLFGLGASLITARDFYLKLLRLGKSAVINDDWHSQFLQARNALPTDLGIAISYSGETAEVIECMKAMKENHAPIISITRFASSTVADLADLNLYASSRESIFRSGAMASRISQLNIIDILYTAFANSSYEYSLAKLSKTHIQKNKSSYKKGE